MTFYSITKRKARKDHVCGMCHRVISPGETYLRGFGADGLAWSWKLCTHCDAVLSIWDIAWDDEYNESTFDEWASDASWRNLRELRDAAGYRMKWRTRLGTLLPIPTREKTA